MVGRWECAVAEGGDYVFPYLRRAVPARADAYDLVTPYGYAGVVAADPRRRAQFVVAARKAGAERGLVAEFLRTNPFDVVDPSDDGLEVDEYRAHPTFAVSLAGPGGRGRLLGPRRGQAPHSGPEG